MWLILKKAKSRLQLGDSRFLIKKIGLESGNKAIFTWLGSIRLVSKSTGTTQGKNWDHLTSRLLKQMLCSEWVFPKLQIFVSLHSSLFQQCNITSIDQ